MSMTEWCRTRPWTWAVAAGVACGAVGYGAGRLGGPSRVQERQERQEAVQAQAQERREERREEAPARIVTVTRWRPAPEAPPPPGCPECPAVREEVRTEERGPVVTTTHTEASSSLQAQAATVTERIVEREFPRLMVGALVGVGPTSDGGAKVTYGGEVKYRVVGPLWLGVQADSQPSGRASVSITF